MVTQTSSRILRFEYVHMANTPPGKGTSNVLLIKKEDASNIQYVFPAIHPYTLESTPHTTA